MRPRCKLDYIEGKLLCALFGDVGLIERRLRYLLPLPRGRQGKKELSQHKKISLFYTDGPRSSDAKLAEESDVL